MHRLGIAGMTWALVLAAPLIWPVATASATGMTSAATPTQVSARHLLSTLTVAAESHTTTYDRSLFRLWVDADSDSCDAREEVLIEESTIPTTRGAACKVLSGKWMSPFDGATWTNPSDVDIDHVVALKEAWDSGAWNWSAAKREHYANDLGWARSLIAVTDNVNSSKSDRDPAEWLPPRMAYRCSYAHSWVQSKYRWQLKVDAAELNTLRYLISGTCGETRITLPAKGV